MNRTSRVVAVVLVVVFAVVVARTAWVSDDAFITLRVAADPANEERRKLLEQAKGAARR